MNQYIDDDNREIETNGLCVPKEFKQSDNRNRALLERLVRSIV